MTSQGKLAELSRIVGTPVSIAPCGRCGQTATLERVHESGNGIATIQLRCHGEASDQQVRAGGELALRIIPFDPKPRFAKERLHGISTGPFRGGIIR